MSKKTLYLGNEELACIEEIPAGLLLDLADAAEKANLATVSGFRRFLYEVVIETEHERLTKLLHSRDPLIDFDALNHAIGNLMLEYTQRPTTPPSGLQPGPDVTGGISRVVSLSPVTVEAASQSSQGGVQAGS